MDDETADAESGPMAAAFSARMQRAQFFYCALESGVAGAEYYTALTATIRMPPNPCTPNDKQRQDIDITDG